MSNYVVPLSQIDPTTLPPALMTSEPDSFAQNTFKVRIPAILDEIIHLNSFPDDINHSLSKLRHEIVSGQIRGLLEDTPDNQFWEQVSLAWLGRSWLDVPWYWAESYFYRRVLEATRYYQPGLFNEFDPYASKKQTELRPDAAPRAIDAVLASLPDSMSERFRLLLYASLWGNRTDLSYNVAKRIRAADRIEDESVNVLVDDTNRIWESMDRASCRHVVIIADNAGTELAMDLALADFLLSDGLVQQVDLHLKCHPFFVSDAMPDDVDAARAALIRGGVQAAQLSQRISAHITEGRLKLEKHWFYTTCLFYYQMPRDLLSALARANLVILKGDANYRRLLGDAHWSPTTDFASVTAYFPSPHACLRTLKAELVVGLTSGMVERLDNEEVDWRTNGRRGVIQASL